MSPHTPTLPPTEPAMWRKLLAAAHPDRGGDHELFIWAMNLRDTVSKEGGVQAPTSSEASDTSSRTTSSDAVPFDEDLDHLTLIRSALDLANKVGEPYAGVLKLLKGCGVAFFGPNYYQQRKGATYRQLAAIAHTVGMSKAQRIRWYRYAEELPMNRWIGHRKVEGRES